MLIHIVKELKELLTFSSDYGERFSSGKLISRRRPKEFKAAQL
jgi:hypothetical protein